MEGQPYLVFPIFHDSLHLEKEDSPTVFNKSVSL